MRRLAWYGMVLRAFRGGDLPCCPECAGVGPLDPVRRLYERWYSKRQP
jgi:hypothetical protein